MPRTVIIGAGISGLAAAHQLRLQGDDVLLLEAGNQIGGVIGSERVDGFLLERGPNTLRGNTPALEDLINLLGIRKANASSASKSRFVLRDDKLIELPQSPLDIFSTAILSTNAKFRAVREPFVTPSTAQDESVGAFFARRFGSEVAEYLADPFVSGIYAGDKDKLSILHTFPNLWKLEQQSGSVIKGMLKSRKNRAKSPKEEGEKPVGIYAFEEGLAELPNAIAKKLGSRLTVGAAVRSVAKEGLRYAVTLSSGSSVQAERVIVSTPAYATATLVKQLAPEASELLNIVRYAPISTLHLGFKKSQFSKLPEGFGFLVPSNAKQSFLGCIYSSSMYPDRAPSDSVLLTVMIGGSSHPEMTRLSSSELTKLVMPELSALLSIKGDPSFTHMHTWERAIPQYEIGYQVVLDAVATAEKANLGLHLLGSYRGGVSVGDCVRNATELAKRLV